MRFEKEDKLVFEIPDRPTVRQQLLYMGKASGVADGTYPLRFWHGACEVITSWECELFPDYKKSLDEVDDPEIAELVMWAGLRTWEYMANLSELPKN